jgi:hypothetical protein
VRPWQRSIGREAALALAVTGWWKHRPAREIAEFQMHTAELCMPFTEFHRAVEVTLGRPVSRRELGLDFDRLRAELMGERPTPTFEHILTLVPPDAATPAGAAS